MPDEPLLPTDDRVHCPSCGKRFRTDGAKAVDGRAARHARCSACGTTFDVRVRVAVAPRPPPASPPSPEGAAPSLPLGERVGRYEVEGVLGRGGMGSVYAAFDPATNRHVALKVLRGDATEEDRRRFQREVEVQGNVHHPHLMPIFDSGMIGASRWYTMELLKDPLSLADLAALLVAGRGVDDVRLKPVSTLEGVIRRVLLPVCQAVHHANTVEGVIHRDLKPQNVLLDRNGLRPFVIDFGVCTLVERKNQRLAHLPREDAVRGPGGVIRVTGTLSYMPPEQARGDVDRRGDVWGLGAILRHLLSGAAPYAPATRSAVPTQERIEGLKLLVEQAERAGSRREAAEFRAKIAEVEASGARTEDDLRHDVLQARYAPLPGDADPGLAAIVEKAMAADPAARYRHALDLHDDLLAWLDGLPVKAMSETTGAAGSAVYHGRLFVRRHGVAFAVLAVLALGGAAVAWWLSRAQPPAPGKTAAQWLADAETARASGDLRAARDRVRRALETDPKAEGAFPLLDRVAADARARDDLERLQRLAAAAERAYAEEDPAAPALTGAAEEQARVVLSAKPPASTVEEVTALLRRARGEVPLAVASPFPEVTLQLLEVRGDRGRVLWDSPRTLPPGIARGTWVLQARRGEGTVFVPFRVRGADAKAEVAVPMDPGVLDRNTLYVGAGRPPRAIGDAAVDALLWDRTEATEERYAKFLASLPPEEQRRRVPRVGGVLGAPDRPLWTEREGRWEPSPGAARRPVESISVEDAKTFAAFEGKRLPTAAEWAWAATGPDGRATPVGAYEDLVAAGIPFGGSRAADVGATAGDVSPFGLADMAANLAEMTGTLATWRGTNGWWVMGGGYATEPSAALADRADPRPGWLPLPGVGVRLVRDVKR